MVNLRTLVVVDMQNDFITGVFGTEEAKNVVPLVKDKMQEYLDDEDYTNIVCTQDTHFPDTWTENVESYLPIHCLIGTEGFELEESIKEIVDANPDSVKVINKFTFGSIKVAESIKEYYDYLLKSLNEEGVPVQNINMEIEVVGLCTDICVVSNALILKAMLPYAKIIVDSNACAGTTPENHEKALDIMSQNGITIID